VKYWIKKHLPRSLFGRFLLIIIVPTVLAQAIAVYMFYERHWRSVKWHLQTSVASEIVLVVNSSLSSPPEDVLAPIELAQQFLYLGIDFIDQGRMQQQVSKTLDGYETFQSHLDKHISLPYYVYQDRDGRDIFVEVEFPNGLMNITVARKRLSNPTSYIFILWMTGTALMLLIISVIFMRNQLRPIVRLAKAAQQFGRGQDIDNFKPEGASEVRKAAEAFLDMKERIDRQVSQRTEMLAGVSHDLKTPITRMKLQLAMMRPSKSIDELKYDVGEMEDMIQAYLDFAKGHEGAVNEPINVSDQLRSIIAGYRDEHNRIELEMKAGVVVIMNPNCFRRVIGNIIDNGLRYAKKIVINVSQTEKYAIIMIDDDGPGIPEKKREQAFKPFQRLDDARNQDKGGVGLGLSVARDLVTRYGGEIYLDQSPRGGLRVIIKLPI
tara:strand:- start:133 stop:1440 length:1308 start_codon:yes stop_codon:yes gene_type:complete